MAKLRTRKHRVVLSRSAGGDTGITILLTFLGAFMLLPMLYAIMQSLKPLDELWRFPPRFYVTKPTLKNFRDLFVLMNTAWVPFSRYLFNTMFTSIVDHCTLFTPRWPRMPWRKSPCRAAERCSGRRCRSCSIRR